MNQQVDPVLANRLGMGVPLLDCQNKLLLFIPRLLDSILRDDCRRTQRIVHHLLGFGHNNIQMRVTLEALGVDLIDVLGAGGPNAKPAALCLDFQTAVRRNSLLQGVQYPQIASISPPEPLRDAARIVEKVERARIETMYVSRTMVPQTMVEFIQCFRYMGIAAPINNVLSVPPPVY